MDHNYAKKTDIDIENNDPDFRLQMDHNYAKINDIDPDFLSGESEVEEINAEDGDVQDPGREAQEGSAEEEAAPTVVTTTSPTNPTSPTLGRLSLDGSALWSQGWRSDPSCAIFSPHF